MSSSPFAALHSQDCKTNHTQNRTHWHLPELSKLHFGKIELLSCGLPSFSDEEKLSGRGTDSSVSVGSERVAEVCVIDRTFQSRVNDMQRKLMQMNPLFFLLINEKIIILWNHESQNHLNNNGCEQNGSCVYHKSLQEKTNGVILHTKSTF